MKPLRFVQPKHDHTLESNVTASTYLSTGLNFVNIAHPDEIRDTTKQRKIRRHVMKNIGKSRRRDQRCPSVGPPRLAPFTSLGWTPVETVLLSWLPMCPYWDQVFSAMKQVNDGPRELSLCHPVIEAPPPNPGSNPGRELVTPRLEHYNKSLNSIRADLADLRDNARVYEAIVTIVRLAVYDVSLPPELCVYISSCLLSKMRVRSGLRWTIHMDGLSQIFASADGVQILKASPALQKALFWYVLTQGSLRAFFTTRYRSSSHHC